MSGWEQDECCDLGQSTRKGLVQKVVSLSVGTACQARRTVKYKGPNVQAVDRGACLKCSTNNAEGSVDQVEG